MKPEIVHIFESSVGLASNNYYPSTSISCAFGAK